MSCKLPFPDLGSPVGFQQEWLWCVMHLTNDEFLFGAGDIALSCWRGVACIECMFIYEEIPCLSCCPLLLWSLSLLYPPDVVVVLSVCRRCVGSGWDG